MKYTKDDIEYLFLNKSFDELSENELKQLEDVASTSEAFENMKRIVLTAQSPSFEEELVPKAETKQQLIEMFKNERWKSGVAFTESSLESERTESERKKSIVPILLTLAAAVVLLFGLFEYQKSEPVAGKYELAQLNLKEKEQLIEEEKSIEIPKEEIEIAKPVKKAEPKIIKEEQEEETVFDVQEDQEEAFFIVDSYATRGDYEDLELINAPLSSKDLDSEKNEIVQLSYSMENDADLIDLLYTAY